MQVTLRAGKGKPDNFPARLIIFAPALSPGERAGSNLSGGSREANNVYNYRDNGPPHETKVNFRNT